MIMAVVQDVYSVIYGLLQQANSGFQVQCRPCGASSRRLSAIIAHLQLCRRLVAPVGGLDVALQDIKQGGGGRNDRPALFGELLDGGLVVFHLLGKAVAEQYSRCLLAGRGLGGARGEEEGSGGAVGAEGVIWQLG